MYSSRGLDARNSQKERGLTVNQLRFLRYIREQADSGEKINYKECALRAGYSESKARNASEILGSAEATRDLVARYLGIDRMTLYSELSKLILQDEDKTNKNRAIHMGLRILGEDKPEDNKVTQVVVNWGDIKLGE